MVDISFGGLKMFSLVSMYYILYIDFIVVFILYYIFLISQDLSILYTRCLHVNQFYKDNIGF